MELSIRPGKRAHETHELETLGTAESVEHVHSGGALLVTEAITPKAPARPNARQTMT